MTSDDSTHLSRRRFVTLAGAAGLGTVATSLAGCGSDSGATASGKKTRKFTFISDVTPYGKHAPFFVALEKGYWSKRGLDIDIQAAKGSVDAVTKLAAGAGQFGFADTSAVILATGNQSVHAKVICMYHYKNLMSEQTLEGRGIKKPKDLVGSTQHVIPGEGTYAMLPALAKANGFDATKVKTVTGEITNLVPSVVSGRADGALTYFTIYPALKAAAEEAGKTPTYFLYADNGVDIYNNGIVVTDSFLEKEPDAVKAFCAGFVDGVVYSAAHPDEATDIFVEKVPGIDKKIAREQLQVALDHLNVDEVHEHGFGPMDPAKMQKTLDLVNKYFTLKQPVTKTDAIYTNDYVPRGKVPQL